MSNVLPLKYRSIEVGRLWTRFLFVGACVLTGGAIVALLALLPALISVRVARTNIHSSDSARIASEDQSAAKRAQALLSVLNPIASATSSPTDALVVALAPRPADISIETITYTSDRSSLVLSGVSERREAVSEYRDALEEIGRFSSVAVPVSALVGTQEGKFTITLTGRF
ncbi:MAG: hypothetical protein AAB605_04435 [Patescibacteria group bacterium]